MDPRLKSIVDNFDSMKIGLDDSFQFHCTKCGKCCIDREDILLTPRDLFNAAAALNMMPPDFVKEYCECYIGQDSRMPIVRLKPRGSIKRCPLLKDQHCLIHKAKPAVCAMFPVGRAITIDKDSYNADGVLNSQIQYIINPINCGDKSEAHTVRDWLTAFGIPIEDKFFFKWQSFLATASSFLRDVEKVFSDETMGEIWTAIYIRIYLDYDPAKAFMPQFERNADELLKTIRKTQKAMETGS